jgi:PAS domain S-box-containing protein
MNQCFRFVACAPIRYYDGVYAPLASFGWVGIAADVAAFHEAATLVGDALQDKVLALVTSTLAVLAATGLAVVLTAVLIFLGAVIMFMSLLGMRQVLRLLRGSKYIRSWQTLFSLMVFFLAGYLAALALVLAGTIDPLAMLTGLIFFFGALFVYLVVRTGQLSIDDLLKTTVAKAYVEDIIKTMADTLIVVNPDLTIQTVNQATRALLGYEESELIGKPVGMIFADEELSGVDCLRSIRNVEKTYLSKDGRRIPVSFSGSVMCDGKSKIQGMVCVAQDITERKRAEEELRKAKEAAEAANRAKSAFLAAMSHEIRTPMNAVIGMTSLLLDTDLIPEQREFVETIRTSGDALLTIINDILDFSKIEAGKMELESQPFNLRECVESALDLLAAQASGKGLDLAYMMDDQIPIAIFGDVTRLRQILVNLLGNAIKFTERGEVVVSVTTPPLRAEGIEDENGYELYFAVRDTGIGIPPERMDRLFQSFSQMDASMTRKYGGTGLGLAISKRLSELMGGTMWVESEVGQGSIFHFTIQAEAAPAPTPVYLQGMQPDLTGKRVLIVDDNDTNRRILTLQTQAWGMLPRSTASPAEALEWIRQGDLFDVAILDMQMPEMDGLAVAKEIRKVRDAQSLPLMMLSSLGQRDADVERDLFSAYLTKPIKASQLYNVLVDILTVEAQPVCRHEEAAKLQFDPRMGRRLPLHILLAEDNAVNQKLALRLLERMGYRADVAANGLEVLEALRRQSYDLVLMDVQMPEMDGLEATRTICQEWPRQQRPRVIAVTANAMKEDREECLAAGMDDYISKPIQVEELVSALRKCQPLAWAKQPDSNV